MGSRDYRTAIDEVITKTIGTEDDGSWNRNFKERLKEYGLELTSELPDGKDERYPDGVPYQAPYPYGHLEGWPEKSYIVYCN